MRDFMNRTGKELSIVIPCLNEARTLPIVVPKALNSLARLNIDGEVIVVDNGSVDDSVSIAERLGARVVHCKTRGYGNALKAGFEAAEGKYLLMGDADDSYNFDEIDGFVQYLREGYDMVVGTRLKGKIEEGAMPPSHRYLGTPVLTFLLNLFFGTRITDCNCGMRGLTKNAFERLPLETEGMEFVSEMVIKAGIHKLTIKEIPITLYRDKRDRRPHLNTWRDGWRNLKFMLVYAPNYLFVYPGIAAFVIGSILTLSQWNGPVRMGFLYVDIHTMILGLTLSLLGEFMFQMGLIIKLYSAQQRYYKSDRLLTWLQGISMERLLVFGGLLVLLGFLIDAYVVVVWARNGFHDIYMPQTAIVGFYFLFTGISIVFFAFLRAIFDRKEPRIVSEQRRLPEQAAG
jgi:glycosyltransferase involved in cell wall biosynthesis